MKKNCFFILLTLLLFSCSTSSIIEKEINVTSSEVYGEESELLSVVPGTYTLRGNKENIDSILSISVGLKIKKTYPDMNIYSADLKMNLIDTNGEPFGENLYPNDDELKEFLNTNKVGSEKVFEFIPILTTDIDQENFDDFIDKVASIKISTGKFTMLERRNPLPSLAISDISLPQQLKGKVEIVTDESGKIPVTFNKYDIPEIEITFRLLKKVPTAGIATSYGQLWIVGLPKDRSGRTIKEIVPNYNEWRTEDSNGSQFKAFLESEPGETITLAFTGSKNDDSSKAYKAAEKISKFSLNFSKF